jgi:type II secretory pathway pseudopilin PulG
MAMTHGHYRRTARRPAWTLAELLTAMGIFTILFGALLYGGRAVRNARNGATAKQQIALLGAAINQYAGFWPKWQVGSVVVADKGWPDFIPGRIFGSCQDNVGDFEEIPGFNDTLTLPVNWLDQPLHVLNANTCLAYELTSSSGKGPYLLDRNGGNFKDGADFSGGARPMYPGFDNTCVPGGGGAARAAEIAADPWGTPLRYFWVYRDPNAHRGYVPAFTADTTDVVNFRKADGFVLESAGHDRKFGNVWKVNPSATEIEDAEDNMVTSP